MLLHVWLRDSHHTYCCAVAVRPSTMYQRHAPLEQMATMDVHQNTGYKSLGSDCGLCAKWNVGYSKHCKYPLPAVAHNVGGIEATNGFQGYTPSTARHIPWLLGRETTGYSFASCGLCYHADGRSAKMNPKDLYHYLLGMSVLPVAREALEHHIADCGLHYRWQRGFEPIPEL